VPELRRLLAVISRFVIGDNVNHFLLSELLFELMNRS